MGRQRFEPEIYLQKAEHDIRKVQTLCSLVEPSWDGYCGLVLLNEDESAQALEDADGEDAEIVEGHDSSRHQPLQEEDIEKQHWQEQTLQKITQQIKNISNVPKPERQKLLSTLAKEARLAAEQCEEQVGEQLLKLAEFASNALKTQSAGTAPDEDSRQANQPSKASLSPRRFTSDEDATERVTADPRVTRQADDHASAANDLFKAAIDLVKRDKLREAVRDLNKALELCPEEKAAARNKIKKYAAAVKAELQRRDGIKASP